MKFAAPQFFAPPVALDLYALPGGALVSYHGAEPIVLTIDEITYPGFTVAELEAAGFVEFEPPEASWTTGDGTTAGDIASFTADAVLVTDGDYTVPTVSLQWQVNDEDVAGATGTTFVRPAGEEGFGLALVQRLVTTHPESPFETRRVVTPTPAILAMNFESSYFTYDAPADTGFTLAVRGRVDTATNPGAMVLMRQDPFVFVSLDPSPNAEIVMRIADSAGILSTLRGDTYAQGVMDFAVLASCDFGGGLTDSGGAPNNAHAAIRTALKVGAGSWVEDFKTFTDSGGALDALRAGDGLINLLGSEFFATITGAVMQSYWLLTAAGNAAVIDPTPAAWASFFDAGDNYYPVVRSDATKVVGGVTPTVFMAGLSSFQNGINLGNGAGALTADIGTLTASLP